MKKLFFLTALCVFCLAFAGCSKETSETTAAGSSSAPTFAASDVPTESTQEAAAPETTVSTEPVSVESVSEDDTSPASPSVFEALPDSFYFSSGVGAWATELSIASDGSFTGGYQDTDMGDTGTDYPNGTVYICRFSGKFSTPQPIDDYSYSMKLESIQLDGTPDDVTYEDGIRYIYSEPYGMDDGGDFLIYLPGIPLSQVAEAFLFWVFIDTTVWDVLPPGYYGIYNVNSEKGFVGVIPQNP